MPRYCSRRLVCVRSLALVFIALGTLVFAGCDNNAPQEAGHPGQQNPGQDKKAQQPIPVAVTSATQGSIASYYNATATLEAEKEAQILARVTGVVNALLAEEGDIVPAGAPLLSIQNEEYRFRVEQTAASAANLRARYERLEKMLAEELATEEEIQTARSDLTNAEANEGLARLDLSYTTVTAPFTGRVTQRLVDIGQNISANTPLFVMADFDPLLARVHVPSREFNRLQKNQPVDLVLDSTGDRLKGRIKLISPVIDPASGTIKITVEISEYPENTRPGEFAQVQIVTEKRDNATLVPRAAVLTDKGESVVFIPLAEGEKLTAERRVVEVGFTDNDNVQILSGLQPGDSVIIKGQRSLKHGAPLKILEDDKDRRPGS
jgi:membrane fusion protein, multidrug efflux system